ncbi:MAG: hypothetical protein R2699_17125 [Acidimicrobiales bacterium]
MGVPGRPARRRRPRRGGGPGGSGPPGGDEEAGEEAGLALDPDELVWFAHWTPPQVSIKRFATFFFVAHAPVDDAGVTIDGGEIHEHGWFAPRRLARRNALEIELSPPTWITLEQLAHADEATPRRRRRCRRGATSPATGPSSSRHASSWPATPPWRSTTATPATGQRRRGAGRPAPAVDGATEGWRCERDDWD